MSITVTYFGHSCFTLSADGYTVALDPYDPTVPGYPRLCVTANMTLCSHEHHDHNFREAVLMPLNELSCPFEIKVLNCFHDEKGGALRGENKIHILSCGKLRVAHLGDLGHLPEGEALKALIGVDLLLIPVGGTYTVDPAQAHELTELIKPRTAVPMHYRRGSTGYDNIAHIDEFLKLCGNVRFLNDSRFVLSEDCDPCTLVMEHFSM